MRYRRAGKSGLLLSEVSLGFWQNFGAEASNEETSAMVGYAFDNGVTYFDLADNYGPPRGAAEERFGRILKNELCSHRDEIVIATKAGHVAWEGPYGDGGGKKHLIASLDKSLKRLSLDYVDIFYHHRPDPNTPLEETAEALSFIVRSGRALYVALSKYYKPEELRRMVKILSDEYRVHPVCMQVKYNLYDRAIEKDGITGILEDLGMGTAVFSPLAQGLLTDKYIKGMPSDSRYGESDFLKGAVNKENIAKIKALNEIALSKGISLSDMALSWVLTRRNISSVIVGARNMDQLKKNIEAADKGISFTEEEEKRLESFFPAV